MAVKAMRIRNWWGLEGDSARRGTMILALPKLVLMYISRILPSLANKSMALISGNLSLKEAMMILPEKS
ncbi:MAG: hypothetical protein F4044_05845 [Rhodobacteraceae bacterium]|nr:hypothetical protein [Paracoccaceae bacterium]